MNKFNHWQGGFWYSTYKTDHTLWKTDPEKDLLFSCVSFCLAWPGHLKRSGLLIVSKLSFLTIFQLLMTLLERIWTSTPTSKMRFVSACSATSIATTPTQSSAWFLMLRLRRATWTQNIRSSRNSCRRSHFSPGSLRLPPLTIPVGFLDQWWEQLLLLRRQQFQGPLVKWHLQ